MNSEFHTVNLRHGHDCFEGACHPQWTAPAYDATTAAGAQQSLARTAQVSRASPRIKKAEKIIAKAVYDANGCIQWRSETHKDGKTQQSVTFTFRPGHPKPGWRRYFYCSDCEELCGKYRKYIKTCGIKRRYVIVLGDNIIDCHPDDAGTNQGHLCRPSTLVEEMLKEAKALGKAAAKGASNIIEKDAKAVPKMKASGKTSRKASNARRRPRAKRPRAGNLKKLADDHRAKCEDRGEPSPKRMCAARNAPPSGGPVRTSIHVQSVATANHFPEATSRTSSDGSIHKGDLDFGPDVDALDESLEYPESSHSVSSAAQDASESRPDTPHKSDVTVSTMQLVVEEVQNSHRLNDRREAAIAADSNQLTPMTPQTSGTSRFTGSTATFGTGTDLDLGLEVALKEESLNYAESTYSVSSASQYVVDQHEVETNMHLDAEEEQKHDRFDAIREVANVDDSTNSTTTTLKTIGTNRFTGSAATPGTRKRFAGSLAGSKPPTKKPVAEVVTIDDSDDDTEAKGTSLATSRASKKPVKREPVENNDAVRPRDHLTVRYTSRSGMVLKATHLSAQMTFRDFRQTFGISQSTQQVFVFKGNDGEWEVIRDGETTLPGVNGHVEARAHHED